MVLRLVCEACRVAEGLSRVGGRVNESGAEFVFAVCAIAGFVISESGSVAIRLDPALFWPCPLYCSHGNGEGRGRNETIEARAHVLLSVICSDRLHKSLSAKTVEAAGIVDRAMLTPPESILPHLSLLHVYFSHATV